jgi:hypothetical protein
MAATAVVNLKETIVGQLNEPGKRIERGDSKNRVAVGTKMLRDHDTDVTLEIGLNL